MYHSLRKNEFKSQPTAEEPDYDMLEKRKNQEADDSAAALLNADSKRAIFGGVIAFAASHQESKIVRDVE